MNGHDHPRLQRQERQATPAGMLAALAESCRASAHVLRICGDLQPWHAEETKGCAAMMAEVAGRCTRMASEGKPPPAPSGIMVPV